MKKFIKKYYILLIILLICLIIINGGIYLYFHNLYKIDKDFTKIDLKDIDNLMIVAHPDDETLWGGAHLIKDNYLVVCITCGSNKTRVNEFNHIMHSTNDKYIMLGYPDKTNGERDNWDTVKDDITKDLDAIIKLKDWQTIVTHNPDGEYGHIHHQMTSQITTSIVPDKKKLYYFGHYYSKNNIVNHLNEMTPINDSLLSQKKKLISYYPSQSFIQTYFDQMFPYEDWVSYYDWGKPSFHVPDDYSKLDLSKTNKLMVVAHPDDELIWGGSHLMNDNYLVVCVTCGVNPVRVKEFERTMKETNDQYIMLGYPDLTNGQKDNWDSSREYIQNDLQSIISLKDWDTIITHNPDGEYGHIHHKMTSTMMTNLVEDKDKLYYFGHYYLNKKDIKKHQKELKRVSSKNLKKKQKIVDEIYVSQYMINDVWGHMLPYENWVKYSEWSES